IDLEIAASGDTADPRERDHLTEIAGDVPALRPRRIARVVPSVGPLEREAPALRLAGRIAKRLEGNCDLDGVLIDADVAGRLEDRVPLLKASALYVEAVALHTERVHHQVESPPPVVGRIDLNPDPVLALHDDVVALVEARANLPRLILGT